MKKEIIYLFALILAAGFITTSCQKDIETDPQPQETETGFESLQVPEGFTWSTINRSAFKVRIVDESGNPTDVLNGYPLDATDLNNNLIQRSSIIDGEARFYLELNAGVNNVRFYSPSHEIDQVLELGASTLPFQVPGTLKSVKNYTDSDNDGVYDDFDQFPDDPEKAYMAYYPSPYKTNSFKSGDDENEKWYYQLFEDLWPTEGDYDMNDLVLKLRMLTYFNAQNEWTGGTFEFYVWSNGAGLDLGCGMEFFNYLSNNGDQIELEYLDTDPDQVTLDAGTYDPAITMLDPDVNNAVIIFNDVSDVKSTNYWNTGIGLTADPTDNYVTFSYSVGPPTYWMAGFLYLFRSDDRSHEVRPVGFPPTTAADLSKLGTYDDASPTTGWNWDPGTTFMYPPSSTPYFYTNESLHPWGVEIEYEGNLPVAFERVSIMEAFPQFQDWAESGGDLNTTWYEYPSADPAKVFHVEDLIVP